MEDSLHELQINPFKAVRELARYVITGGGTFSHSFNNTSTFFPARLLDDTGAFSSKTQQDLDATIPENRPDIELMHVPYNCSDFEINGKGMFSLLVALVRPQSQGTVRLATANPRAHPNVDLGFLSDPSDYEPLRKGLRLSMRLFDDIRAQGYPVLGDLQFPPGGTAADDETLDAYIRAHLRTCFHYTYSSIIPSHSRQHSHVMTHFL